MDIQATEQEQAQLEKYVLDAATMMADKNAANQLVNTLKETGNVEEGVANIVFLLVTQLDDRNNGQLPEELILPLAEEVIALSVEFAEAALNGEIDEVQVEKITQLVVQRLMEEYGVSESDLQEIADDIDPQELKKMVDQTSQRFGGEAVFG